MRALGPAGKSMGKVVGKAKGSLHAAAGSTAALASHAHTLLQRDSDVSDLEEGRMHSHRRWRCCRLCAPSCSPSCDSYSGPGAEHLHRLRDNLAFRISVAPIALVVAWTLVRLVVGGLHVGVILAMLLPYLSVALSIVTLVAQSYLVSLPLARAVSGLLGQLAGIIDTSFRELLELLPRSITALLTALGIPEMLVGNFCKVLFLPLQEALNTVLHLMPRVDEIFPSWSKRPSPLVPIVCAGLLTGLVCAQVLLLLTLGMAGAGDVGVAICLGLCYAQAVLAKNADELLPLILGAVEGVINGTVQFLLRRVLMVDKLQAGIDMVIKAIPDPQIAARAMGKGARAVGKGAKAVGKDTAAVGRKVGMGVRDCLCMGCARSKKAPRGGARRTSSASSDEEEASAAAAVAATSANKHHHQDQHCGHGAAARMIMTTNTSSSAAML